MVVDFWPAEKPELGILNYQDCQFKSDMDQEKYASNLWNFVQSKERVLWECGPKP